MKNKKLPGPGNFLTSTTFTLFSEENVPEELNWHTYVLYTRKETKYVTSSMGWLFGRILKNTSEEQIIDIEEQNDFCSGRSCMDDIFVLNHLLKTKTINSKY